MNKLSLGLDSPWIQLLQSRRIKRLPLWILAAVSDREKRDFALTAGSSFGLIYNMNNERSIFVKKLEDRKLNRRNTVLVRAPDGHFGQLGGFGGGLLPSELDTQPIHARQGITGANAKARFLKRCATSPFVVWMQALIEGCCDENVACAFIRKSEVGLGGGSFLLRGPSDFNAHYEVTNGTSVSAGPA